MSGSSLSLRCQVAEAKPGVVLERGDKYEHKYALTLYRY